MKFLYNFIVFITSLLLPIIALFNKKIKLFVDGRNETFSKISELKNSKTIWFHAASLGEFEQARPIIEEIKEKYPSYKVFCCSVHSDISSSFSLVRVFSNVFWAFCSQIVLFCIRWIFRSMALMAFVTPALIISSIARGVAFALPTGSTDKEQHSSMTVIILKYLFIAYFFL